MIAEFLDRVGSAIDDRVDARLAERRQSTRVPGSRLVLPLTSLVLGIPITAIAAEHGRGVRRTPPSGSAARRATSACA